MGSIGVWQVLLILAIVLIIFGAGKLPRVMGDVAKGVKNFKEGMKEEDRAEETESPRTLDRSGEETVSSGSQESHSKDEKKAS